MRKITRSLLNKKIKVVFSKYIIKRAGGCEMAGKIDGKFASCGGGLQCSHIKTVGAYKNLRFDPYNALALCYRHHIHYWHKEKGEAYKWFEKHYPTRVVYLDHNKNKLFKPTLDDLQELYEMYKAKGGE